MSSRYSRYFLLYLRFLQGTYNHDDLVLVHIQQNPWIRLASNSKVSCDCADKLDFHISHLAVLITLQLVLLQGL